VVSSYANFIPDWTYSLYQAAEVRDFNKMDVIFKKMSLLVDFVAKVTNTRPNIGVNAPAPMYLPVVKAAMDIVGLHGSLPRLPITGLTNEEKTELAGILKALKISC
jgi:dihydrodipicolinate synthase/N-acetylneuraminate lyase